MMPNPFPKESQTSEDVRDSALLRQAIAEAKGEFVTVEELLAEKGLPSFTAFVHQEEDLFVADCFEKGTVSQGETVKEAIAYLKEATELHLEEFPLNEY